MGRIPKAPPRPPPVSDTWYTLADGTKISNKILDDLLLLAKTHVGLADSLSTVLCLYKLVKNVDKDV